MYSYCIDKVLVRKGTQNVDDICIVIIQILV